MQIPLGRVAELIYGKPSLVNVHGSKVPVTQAILSPVTKIYVCGYAARQNSANINII